MARLGRENESATFTSSPTPVKRRSKSKGKDKTNADTDTSTSTSANPLDEFANEATSASKNTVAIFRDTAKGAVSANENSAEAGTSSTASPAVGPTDLEELAEDKDNRHKSDPGLDLPSSAPSSSDLYTPLLTFICEHNFMRKKQYPVLRSSRVEFVRDVNEEGKRLGYHQAVVDRVLLDIKRYYLVKVEWPHAFTEGMEFGDEFDDTPLSSVSEVSKDNGLSKDKQPEGLPLGIKFSKERQTVRDAISGSSRAPVYRYGLDPYDLSEEIYDTSPTPQKLDVSHCAGFLRTNDLPGLTTGDEVRSKYFVKSQARTCLTIESVDTEASRETPQSQPLSKEVLAMLEGMGLVSDFLLSDSDSTLSDTPLPVGELDGVAESSSEPAKPAVCCIPHDSRAQTPPQLDMPLKTLPEKKPRLKPTKKSPYFQGPLVNEDSCLPFPPIDSPSFGLIQEQLAHDPFRLILATIFLNRTRGGVALPILFQVFDRYPTIEAMAAANPEELTAMINRLGFQNQRARKCIAMAQTWLNNPPTHGKRYRKLNYPAKSDGRDIKPTECIPDDDPRVGWEIAHLPGAGAYALDSWRIFCRDELRGLVKDWQGGVAETEDFTPEWKSVLPMDKELRAYLTWMWLKEGWVWDRETGNRARASEKVMRAARRGATAHIEEGNWVLETSPVKRSPSHAMFLPLRLNDRDRNRDPSRKLSSTSSTSLKSKHKQHRSSSQKQPNLPSTKDQDDPEPPVRASTPSASAPKSRKQRRSSMPGLDSASRSQTASFLESRTSLPYPTFSKAHSREAVGKPGVPTPDPTDLTEQFDDDDNHDSKQQRPDSRNAPPSPPLTSTDQHSRKGSTVDDKGEKTEKVVKDGKTKIRIKTDLNRSSSSLRAKKEKDDGSKTSKSTVRPETPKSKRSSHSKEKDTPSRSASHKPSKSKLDHERKRTPPPRSPPHVRDVGMGSANGSDATIAAPRHSPSSRVKSPEKPPSRTQSRSSMSNRPSSVNHHRTPFEAAMDYGRPPTFGSTYGTPPPPPPPPDVPVSNPRVDYLLHNGGLEYQVPKSLLLNSVFGDQPQVQPHLAASRVFEPFNRLLDDYQSVVNKNGSLAVATGSRSVARRLLDRLEAVFARDISSEACRCLMCEHEDYKELPSGVSWGEVLELVSGRRELPTWPPFILTTELGAADLSGDEHIPMQKMDIDVPEEYREHFLRQSRKTKTAVDKWLAEQVEQPTSAPDEVDDETLTFAMLTHLGTEQRPIFRALLGITGTSSTPRPDGPRERPEALVSSSYAIQRLYRLSSRPRDPETAIYMLNNPAIHHVLATLAAISDDEWDILVSGRFDGFLRSGAEDTTSTPNRYSASRSNTPFSAATANGRMSRGPTPNPLDRPMSQPYGPNSPGTYGGPIALDEEMEIAALAEVEREIYAGMEALEDAFEALHCKAESVRLALRERGAGLSIANQNRRGTFVEARLGTPASQYPWESGTDDDFLDDVMSLAPDDSASNISSNRRRRPKRRTERRTPAPVEEEDEGEDELVGRRDSRNSRRR
ncbi:uncharacterized protein BDV17DRAFT_285614 [Aspergillus undulatus]|uniref:uncharacterized protein n=1 Tax=Aspergillus undulatus TaxID=1810928 RepID=UPI003CCD3AA0